MWLDNFNRLRERSGLSLDELSECSGIPKSTLSKISAGITKSPSIETIKSLVYSMGYTLADLDDSSPIADFSIEEFDHIKKYRALDEHGKEIVNLVVDRELQRTQVIASLKKQLSEMEAAAEYMSVIPLRVSTQKVAAGNGVYLGPEDFDIIKVQETELTRMANFAVPVSGDSMEPKFHDGDILLVGEELPEIGDIGIFTMDGYGYVKQRGENELISLNLQYPPIPMKDSIISNGKVIGVLDSSWIVE